jgi:hypothetical protein
MDRPPCLDTLGVTPCLRRQHDWLVYGNGELHGKWTGWRIAGDELVAPNRLRSRWWSPGRGVRSRGRDG